METTGPLSPEMLQVLMRSMQSQVNPSFMQNPGSASGAYQPRFTAPDISTSQGFSLAQTFGRFGEGPGMAGMAADMLLPMFFKSQGGDGLDWQNFVNRMSLARGVANPIREVQAREYARVRASLGNQDLGRAAVSALGIDPQGMFASTLMSSAPVLDQLTDGLVSDAARLIDPNLMTTRGSDALMNAQRSRNTMYRLDSAMVGHLKNTLQERSRLNTRGEHYGNVGGDPNDFKLRDNVLTSGMNLDDFSAVMAAAVDLNALDYSGSLGGDKLDEKAKAALEERVGKGKYTSEQLAAEKKAIRLAGATVQGGSNLSRVVATLGSTLGEGMAVGERANLAAQLGMVPGSSAEASNFQDILRNLKALGDAAGMTSKQMLDAGTAITRQYGGNLLFNTAAASMAQTTIRLTGQSLNDSGIRGGASALEEAGSRLATETVQSGSSDLTRAMVYGYASPEHRKVIKAALQDPQNGGRMIMDYLRTPEGMGLIAGSRNLTGSMVNDGINTLRAMGHDVNSTASDAISAGYVENLKRSSHVTHEGKKIDLVGLYTKFVGMDLPTSEALWSLGTNAVQTDEAEEKFNKLAKQTGLNLTRPQLLAAMVSGEQQLSSAVFRYNAARGKRDRKPEQEEAVIKQQIAELVTGTLNQAGVGGVLDQVRGGKFDPMKGENWKALLDKSNLALPADRANFLTTLEGADRNRLDQSKSILVDFVAARDAMSAANGNPDKITSLAPALEKAAARVRSELGFEPITGLSGLGKPGGGAQPVSGNEKKEKKENYEIAITVHVEASKLIDTYLTASETPSANRADFTSGLNSARLTLRPGER